MDEAIEVRGGHSPAVVLEERARYAALRDLFMKYLDHVGACEGWNYIDSYFTSDEVDILDNLYRVGISKFGNHPYTSTVSIPNLDLIR